jgi:hypothetical protein
VTTWEAAAEAIRVAVGASRIHVRPNVSRTSLVLVLGFGDPLTTPVAAKVGAADAPVLDISRVPMGCTEDGNVFTIHGTGNAGRSSELPPRFQERAAKAGVPVTTVHATRHACASLLVALDVHPRVAMQILRHSQIAVTMEVYSQVSSSSTLAALRRLGEQLDGPGAASLGRSLQHFAAVLVRICGHANGSK